MELKIRQVNINIRYMELKIRQVNINKELRMTPLITKKINYHK